MSRLIEAAAVLICFHSFTSAQEYAFSSIDFPGAADTLVFGINNNGVVVGEYGEIDFSVPFVPGNSGFVFDGTSYTSVEFPGAVATSAIGIDDVGNIVGQYVSETGALHGFLFDGAEYLDIITPFAEGAAATDVNGSGVIVGSYSSDMFVNDVHGYSLTEESFTKFDFPGALSTFVWGINVGGQQVGTFVGLGTVGGFVQPGLKILSHPRGLTTEANGISDNGKVVGRTTVLFSLVEAGFQGFIYDTSTDEFVDVDLPGIDCTFNPFVTPTVCNNAIRDINETGMIAGYFDDGDGEFHGFIGTLEESRALQAGDADQDFDFDQVDLVRVQQAGKYLNGEVATWGEGDWNGAPGGEPGNPPAGDGLFDQSDIIAAQQAGLYLGGRYAALQSSREANDGQTSTFNDASGVELEVEVLADEGLSSMNIDQVDGMLAGHPRQNLDGSFFENDANSNISKTSLAGPFLSSRLGEFAPTGLRDDFIVGDVTVIRCLDRGDLEQVDLIYLPESSTLLLLVTALGPLVVCRHCRC